MVPRRFWFALIAFLSLSSQLLQAAPSVPSSSTDFSTGLPSTKPTVGLFTKISRIICIGLVVVFLVLIILCNIIDDYHEQAAANSVAKQTTTATTSQVEPTSTSTTTTGVA